MLIATLYVFCKYEIFNFDLFLYLWSIILEKGNKISIYIARIIIILGSPIVPAMIIISKERAKDKLDSLKTKYDKAGKTAKESVIEEFDHNAKFIKEAR